eukprot:2589785-Amphidinium_carterae.1
MYDSGAAVSVAPPSFAPHEPLQPTTRDQKLQSVTDAEIKIHAFKKRTIRSRGIGLRVNVIICDVSCPIIGNSMMEENQCYADVKPPLHKSWIMSLHSAHGTAMVKIGKHYYIHSLLLDGFVNKVQLSKSQINASLQNESHNGFCGSDMVTHEEESDQQHADDVARSFNIFDPENKPTEYTADDTQASTSEPAPPINVASPQEPSAAERKLRNLTHIPFRS